MLTHDQMLVIAQRFVNGEIGDIEFLSSLFVSKEAWGYIDALKDMPATVHRRINVEHLTLPATEPAVVNKVATKKPDMRIVADYFDKLARRISTREFTTSGDVLRTKVVINCTEGDGLDDEEEDAVYTFHMLDVETAEALRWHLTGRISDGKDPLTLVCTYRELFERNILPPRAVLTHHLTAPKMKAKAKSKAKDTGQ